MKRILATILSVMLVATLAISGTVAYLTDDESAVNVMTVGKVNVRLWEHQRELDKEGKPSTDAGADLELFEDNKNMMPVVKVGGEDRWGLSLDKNYTDKIVRVENIGESDAYVRVFIAIPSALEKAFTLADGTSVVPLHWDLGSEFNPLDDTAYKAEEYEGLFNKQFDETAKTDVSKRISDFEIKDEENVDAKYNIYCFTYKGGENGVLVADDAGQDMTTAVMVGFYLDSAVDYDDEENFYYVGSKDNKIDYDLNKEVKIPVYVQAIQAEGFANADAAFDAAQMPDNPWKIADQDYGNMLPESKELINDAEALKEALENAKPGDTFVLGKGITGKVTLPTELEGVTIVGQDDVELN